jgi:hypothetical protein
MENLIDLLKETGGIFNVKFYKQDGTLRSINARFGVRKGVTGAGLKYNPSERNNIVVFSMNDNGFRTVKLNNVVSIKFNGLTLLNKL